MRCFILFLVVLCGCAGETLEEELLRLNKHGKEVSDRAYKKKCEIIDAEAAIEQKKIADEAAEFREVVEKIRQLNNEIRKKNNESLRTSSP